MPVIEKIQNLIRHGKNARQNDNNSSPTKQRHAHSDPTGAGKAPIEVPRQQQPQQQQQQESQKPQKVNDDILARLVAEEKENKGKLPSYPGLQRYKLIEKMGDGAFSNVYRALDLEGNQGEVAIKVVRKYELNSSQRANILKEVQIMRNLNHPNIVKLIEFSECRSYYYIVLELLKGGELFHQIVRLTYFSEELSRHVIVQVAEALKYLHEEKGVVHRDIKPENLLFEPIQFVPSKNPKPVQPGDEDKEDEGEFIPGVGSGGIGRIKVADFGLSKVVWDSQTMTPCGTVGYTAPEIVRDERYSKSVDMWALGCVLYTLLCGFPPFYDESINVLTEKVAKGQYTFLSPWWDNISKSAQDLISHLLTVDPDERYDINQFLAHPWIRGTDEETVPARDAPPTATPKVNKDQYMDTPLFYDQDFTPYAPGMAGTQKRMDFRSPGAVALREVFDVGYAVHRMEEENKRRKNWKHGGRGGELNGLDEEEEDEEGDSGVGGVTEGLKNSSLAGGKKVRTTEPTAKSKPKKRNGVFELNMDGATLLERRGRKQA